MALDVDDLARRRTPLSLLVQGANWKPRLQALLASERPAP